MKEKSDYERPLTEAELKAPIDSQTFFRKAKHFIAQNRLGENLFAIKPGAEGWNQWREYFERHLRWTPVVMRKIIDDAPDKPKEGMTVPTLYPQHFDQSFRELEGWAPKPPKKYNRLDHETMEQLRAKYGPSWGLKVIEHEKQQKKQWKAPDWQDIQISDQLRENLTGRAK